MAQDQNQNQNQSTSQQASAIASRALQNPGSLTPQEIQTLAASVLNRNPDRQSQQSQSHQNPSQQKR
jgi:hypothetical protein